MRAIINDDISASFQRIKVIFFLIWGRTKRYFKWSHNKQLLNATTANTYNLTSTSTLFEFFRKFSDRLHFWHYHINLN